MPNKALQFQTTLAGLHYRFRQIREGNELCATLAFSLSVVHEMA